MNHTFFIMLVMASGFFAGLAAAAEVIVRDADALRSAIRELKPGTTLKIAPGQYPGGHYVSGIADLTIEGLDPDQQPLFRGGSNAWHFSCCPNLTLRHLQMSGQRPLNIGGSTGLSLFRPPGAKYEAQAIVARDNVIEGSPCAAAFVGVDGAEFTGNTILFPEKWIFRILQETTAPGFVKSRNVLVKDNRIVFRRFQVQVELNIGSGTEPESLRFEGNHWFAADRPDASQPRLPVKEIGGSYGVDPRPKP